jgi:hypothetical protein
MLWNMWTNTKLACQTWTLFPQAGWSLVYSSQI